MTDGSKKPMSNRVKKNSYLQGLSDSSKRNDTFVSLLHSPDGESETRRSVWPDQSQRQLVLFLLFHANVRARADASARET